LTFGPDGNVYFVEADHDQFPAFITTIDTQSGCIQRLTLNCESLLARTVQRIDNFVWDSATQEFLAYVGRAESAIAPVFMRVRPHDKSMECTLIYLFGQYNSTHVARGSAIVTSAQAPTGRAYLFTVLRIVDPNEVPTTILSEEQADWTSEKQVDPDYEPEEEDLEIKYGYQVDARTGTAYSNRLTTTSFARDLIGATFHVGS